MGKNLLLWLIIAAVLLTVFNNFSAQNEPQEISYTEFVSAVRLDQVDAVMMDRTKIIGEQKKK